MSDERGFEQWWESTDLPLYKLETIKAAFSAGAASRDAEISTLQQEAKRVYDRDTKLLNTHAGAEVLYLDRLSAANRRADESEFKVASLQSTITKAWEPYDPKEPVQPLMRAIAEMTDTEEGIIILRAKLYTEQLLETARSEVAALRKVLEAVEWVAHWNMNYCPWCHGLPIDGHESNCSRQLALGEVKP